MVRLPGVLPGLPGLARLPLPVGAQLAQWRGLFSSGVVCLTVG